MSASIAAGRWRRAEASCSIPPISSSRTRRSPIDDGVCLTATLEILRAISDGRGPDRALLALGYAGWAPGQLEFEIQANGWLHSQADRSILFDADIDTKYDRALAKIGISPAMLSADAGHA